MNAIPLHLQRKFERRSAARFRSQAASAVPQSNQLKGADNALPRPEKAKESPTESGKQARQGS